LISKTTDRFWKCYTELPVEIKKSSKQAYKLFIQNPYHPGLHFKRIHSQRPVFSVRISKNYRAVGIQQNNELIWFWIGSHREYEKLLVQMRK
jgi:hypothetical protein